MNYFTLADVPRREPSIGHGGKLHGNRRPFALEMTWARYALMVGREHLGERCFADVKLACATFDHNVELSQLDKNTHEYVDMLVLEAEKLKKTVKEILHQFVWFMDFDISYKTLMESKHRNPSIKDNFGAMPNNSMMRAVANALYKTDYKIVLGERESKTTVGGNTSPTKLFTIRQETVEATHWTTLFNPCDTKSLRIMTLTQN